MFVQKKKSTNEREGFFYLINNQEKMYIGPIDKQARKQIETALQRKLNTGKAIFSPRYALHLDDIVKLVVIKLISRLT